MYWDSYVLGVVHILGYQPKEWGGGGGGEGGG